MFLLPRRPPAAWNKRLRVARNLLNLATNVSRARFSHTTSIRRRLDYRSRGECISACQQCAEPGVIANSSPHALCSRRLHLDVQHVQRRWLRRRRGAGHGVRGALRLRERDRVTDVVCLASTAAVRSIPMAMPPWGGAPNSKASSMWPKRSRACSSVMLAKKNLLPAHRGCGYGCCRRPPPGRCTPGRRRCCAPCRDRAISSARSSGIAAVKR